MRFEGSEEVRVSFGRPHTRKKFAANSRCGAEISPNSSIGRKKKKKKSAKLTCLPRSSRAPTISPPRFRRRTTFSPPHLVRTRRRTVRYRSRRDLGLEHVPTTTTKTKTTLLLVGREDLMTRSLLRWWLLWFRCGQLLLHLGTCSADHCYCSSSVWCRLSGALSASDLLRPGRAL